VLGLGFGCASADQGQDCSGNGTQHCAPSCPQPPGKIIEMRFFHGRALKNDDRVRFKGPLNGNLKRRPNTNGK
jgi:hypothetical protein